MEVEDHLSEDVLAVRLQKEEAHNFFHSFGSVGACELAFLQPELVQNPSPLEAKYLPKPTQT